MKISIITATYNSYTTLEECMNSVLNQSYAQLEYIVVDGASTDGSVALIQEKAKHYQHITWVSEPDKGIYDALNKGVSMATGDIIGFLHADDLFATNTILEEIAHIFEQEACDGVYGNLHYVSAENTSKIIRNWTSQEFTPQLLKRGWMPAHPTLYLKSKIYRTYGSFDVSYKIAADYDFVLRIFKQPSLHFNFLPKTIVKMRVGGASNRDLKHIIQKMKEDFKALKKNKAGGMHTLIFKNLSKIPQFFKSNTIGY